MLVELLRWNQIHAIVRSRCISVGLRPTCHGQTTADRHGRHAANVQRKGCLYLILYILVVDICGRFISNWHQLSLNHCPTADIITCDHRSLMLLFHCVPSCSIQPRRRYSCSFRKSTSTLSAEGQTNGHGATLSLKQWLRQSHHCDFRSARWCYVSMPVGHPKKPVAPASAPPEPPSQCVSSAWPPGRAPELRSLEQTFTRWEGCNNSAGVGH